MSKIAIVSESMKMGGTEVAIVSLIKKLINNNHDVTLFLVGKHGELLDRIPSDVTIKEIEFKKEKYRLIADSSYVLPKYKIIKRIKRKFLLLLLKNKNFYEEILKKCVSVDDEFDLVCDAFGYGRFTTPFAALCLKGKKKALWFHDENLHWINKSIKFFPYFNKLYCVSNSVKNELLKIDNKDEYKCEVLHNFIDADDIRNKANILDERFDSNAAFNILTIGRLEEQKGIDIAIDTAKILLNENISFCWYVIGSGSLKDDLNNSIIQNGLENNFKLLGLKKNPYSLLNNCDLYVQPSRHEGYPITLIEARALYKPIIASNIPSIAEQIKNGFNGYLVELNSKEFAKKIIEVISDSHKLKSIIENLKKEEIDYSYDYIKIKELLEEK